MNMVVIDKNPLRRGGPPCPPAQDGVTDYNRNNDHKPVIELVHHAMLFWPDCNECILEWSATDGHSV